MSEPYKNPPGYTPIYKALQRVHGHKFPDGIYRDVEPGEPIPGAENWSNPHLWCKRGVVARIDGRESSPHDPHGPYVPPHALTEEDVAHIAEIKRQKLAGTYEGPGMWNKLTPAQAEALAKQPQAATDPTEEEMDNTPDVLPAAPKSVAELKSMARGELVKYAENMEVKLNGNEDKHGIIAKLTAGL